MPDAVLSAIEVFQGSNALRLAVPFVLFTTLAVVARGRAALRLSDETLRSVTLTFMILLTNGLLAAFLVLDIDLTVSPWSKVGLPHVDTALWAALPWPLAVVAAVVLLDFADYWTHRVMHNTPLWGVHAVHHSDRNLTWLTSSRVHVFETTIVRLGYLVLIGWTGLPLWALGGANIVAYLHNRYVHCHLGWNHGPLAKVIASPNWHRWHHSVDPEAYNKNYANLFSGFDVLFGTYYNPGLCDTEVGLHEAPNPGFLDQMLSPFTHVASQLQAMRARQ